MQPDAKQRSLVYSQPVTLRACAEEAATRAALFTHSPAYRTLSGGLELTSTIFGTSESKHPCPSGFQVGLFSDCALSNAKHTDELCFTLNISTAMIVVMGCVSNRKTLTHLTVFINSENP